MELRPPLHLDVVANEKGAFGSPSTMVTSLFPVEKSQKNQDTKFSLEKLFENVPRMTFSNNYAFIAW